MNPASPEIRKTILVVEVNALVRQLLLDVVAHSNRYDILTADGQSRALQQSGEFKGEIHLLLTDAYVSGMSSIDLATAMMIDRPNLIVVIISEFPAGTLVKDNRWHFVPKPFVVSQLRALVARLMFPG